MPSSLTLLALFSAISLTLATPQPLTSDSTALTSPGGQAEKQIDCGEKVDKETYPFIWECVQAVQSAPKTGGLAFDERTPLRDWTSGKCFAIVGLPHEKSTPASVTWNDVHFAFAQLMTACSRSGPNRDILPRAAGTLLLGPMQRVRVTLAKPPKNKPLTTSLGGTVNGTLGADDSGSVQVDWDVYKEIVASASGGLTEPGNVTEEVVAS